MEKLPFEGSLAYGEYDFIASLEFHSVAELENLKKSLYKLIGIGNFVIYVVRYSKIQPK
ncbi:hypothetical protein [Thermococcus sp. MV5]|uniref:hypothetical protein n=1 Tax=Thermococcus sp. MV5 TaxID=1638272 RepID=UPI0019802989|nr:hypothetical protein [Thermococcus sp. MV5]